MHLDIATSEELVHILINDSLLNDYFVEFCNQKVFPVKPTLNYSTNNPTKLFQETPSNNNNDHQYKWTWNFLFKHRIPFFKYSICYHEYKFFKCLLHETNLKTNRNKLPPIKLRRESKSAPAVKASFSNSQSVQHDGSFLKRSSSFFAFTNNENDIEPYDSYETTATVLLENMSERKCFLNFLEENSVNKFFILWMKIENCKDVISLTEDEQTIKDKKLYLLRLLQGQFKAHLIDAPKNIFPKSIGDISSQFFTVLQNEVMKRLVSYWLPRYLLHSSANKSNLASTIMPSMLLSEGKEFISSKNSVSFTPINELASYEILRKRLVNSDCMSALKMDRNCGYPFSSWITSTYPDMEFAALFWLDMNEYLEEFYLLTDSTLKLLSLWKIFHNYFNAESVLASTETIVRIQTSMKNLTKLTKANIHSIYNPLMEMAVHLIDNYWEEYCECDHGNFERSEILSAVSPALSSVLQRRRELLTSSIPRTALLSSYSKKRISKILDEEHKTDKKEKRRKKKKKIKPVHVKDNEDKSSDDNEDDDDDFMENMGDSLKMSQFKSYIQLEEGRLAMNDLLLFLEIEIYFSLGRGKNTQKQQTAMALFKTFFDPTSRKAANLPEGFVASVNSERPSTPVLREAQQYVLPELQKNYRNFYAARKKLEKLALEKEILGGDEKETKKMKLNNLKSLQNDSMTMNKGRNRKGSGRAQVTKKDRTSFFSLLSSSSSSTTSLQMNVFRRYLLKYEGSGFPRLDKDLIFCAEVTKFKELFSYLDEKSLLKKIEVIIDVFLDSASPPWLQIDIPAELASKITQRFQQNFSTKRKVTIQPQCDLTIFDEAYNLVVKVLLPFWSGFQQHLTSLHWNQMVGKMTKAEKKQRRLKKEFNKFQSRTEPIQVALSTVDVIKKDLDGDDDLPSKTVLNFSLKNGYEWKSVPCEVNNRRRRRATLLSKSVGIDLT